MRDSPKVNVFCAISKKCVYAPFFFEGATVNSEAYLAMLQNWLMELLFEGERALYFPTGWGTTSLEFQCKTVSECYSA